jgi:hypothetical protein
MRGLRVPLRRPGMVERFTERARRAMVDGGEPVFSHELKAILETALKLRRRSDSAIGPEHLLLGLLIDPASAAGRILRAAGSDFEAVCRMGFVVPGGERRFFLVTSPWLARP